MWQDNYNCVISDENISLEINSSIYYCKVVGILKAIRTTVSKAVARIIPPLPAAKMKKVVALKDHQITLCHRLNQSWLQANPASRIIFKSLQSGSKLKPLGEKSFKIETVPKSSIWFSFFTYLSNQFFIEILKIQIDRSSPTNLARENERLRVLNREPIRNRRSESALRISLVQR